MDGFFPFLRWILEHAPGILGYALFMVLAGINLWAFVKIGPQLVVALVRAADVNKQAIDAVESVMAAVESLEASNSQDHRLIADLLRETRAMAKRIQDRLPAQEEGSEP